MAKTFIQEEDVVKLQILNLAAKLVITNSKQTKLLCQYVFNLAKYDQNYDNRDRSRFLRQLVLPSGEKGMLAKYAKKIFLATKSAPVLESKFKDRDNYQLGTLSHIINARATGYQQLPDWPEVAPDPTVRNVEVVMPWPEKTSAKKTKLKPEKSFYSEDESSPKDESDSESEEDSDSEEDDSEEESSEEEEDSSEPDTKPKPKKVLKSASDSEAGSDDDSEEDEDSSEEESSSEESSDSKVETAVKKKPTKQNVPKKRVEESRKQPAQDLDLLLDLGDMAPPSGASSSAATPGDMLTTLMALDISDQPPATTRVSPSAAMFAPAVPSKSYELLNKMKGNGLRVTYKFTRTISIFSPKKASIELSFTNESDSKVCTIKIGEKKIQSEMEIQEFPEIAALAPNNSTSVLMAINFNDTTQPAAFELCTGERKYNVSITAPVGELLQPYTMNEKDFIKEQGKLFGMNENSCKVELKEGRTDMKSIISCVQSVANVLLVPSADNDMYRFSAQTMATGTLVLISVVVKDLTGKLTVNCEKMVIGTMLMKDLKDTFAS